MPGLDLFIDLAVGLVLIWVVTEDLRQFRIRNSVVLLLAAGFVLGCLAKDRLDLVLPHAVFATVGLILLFLAASFGVIGGGDAKLLSVALLWIGPEGAFVFSVALLLGATLYVGGAKFGWLPSRERSGRTEIPFGPSIAAAWIVVLVLSAYIKMQEI